MKKSRKIVAALFAAAIAVSAMSATVTAQAAEEQSTVQSFSAGIQPYADVIVTKYRAYQGKFQKRRWNETRGYWVDPDWITIGTQV